MLSCTVNQWEDIYIYIEREGDGGGIHPDDELCDTMVMFDCLMVAV
jgi:hypothetical protein